MSAELIPIKAGQHSVVLVPRTTTDLPFFYLTKQKSSLTRNIDYEGIDLQGRPMRWQVFPSNNPAIGAPSIKAHEVWYRLIKPAIDEWVNRTRPNPEIIPLGKLRECLRTVDWTEGGFEARDFIKCLRQIGAAWCVADLWIPTTETDEEGNTIFQHINAEFSKLTLYAIGKTHLTEEQVKSGKFKFDFNLEDTVYIQLHPIEAKIQKNQPQKYLDIQYQFSVDPASRRWYELMAAKIFGVVKNKGEFCEIRYSWYVKHHHTLKRLYQRFRVVEQMNRAAKDHLDSGYISKVEYRAIKEPDQELDYIIRYYPGEGAKESIARIQGHIYRRRSQKKLATKAPELPTEQGSEAPQAQVLALSVSTAQDEQVILQLLTFGVVYEKAFELATEKRDATRQQLAYWPYRAGEAKKNRAGWIIRAIERNYSAPQGYLEVKEQEASQKQKAEEAAARKQAQDEQEQKAQEARAADDARLAALPEATRSALEAQAIEQARRQYGWMRKKNWDGPLMQAAVRKIMIELLDSQEQGSDPDPIN